MNLLANLPTSIQSLLLRVARLAHDQHTSLWLVGGVVRDLLLGRPLDYDLDLVIEGDAIALAQALATALDGKIMATYAPFGTATVALPVMSDPGTSTIINLDLAMARTETYARPAALPIVQPATLIQDLARRDFSINAMAVEVCVIAEQVIAGLLLDPFNGQHDLADGILRVLHNCSFDDDPTRMLRGLRLAARMDLQLEPHTYALLTNALSRTRLENTSPDRVRTELCLALAEPRPEHVLHLADTWSITPHIFPSLGWSASLAARCNRARSHAGDSLAVDPLIYAGLLTYDLLATQRQALSQRYRLPGEAIRLLHEVSSLQALQPALTVPNMRHSDLDNLLQPFSPTSLKVVCLAETPPMSDHISYYLTHLRDVKPLLDGHTLQRLGVPPGPRLGQILTALRAARLDGLIATRAEAEARVLDMLTQDE